MAVTGNRKALSSVAMKEQIRYAVQVVLVAALYFGAAKLALALAIPPGYASAVWPSSGIALAAMLVLGWRCWPGVWLGAALANFTIQYSAPLAAAIATGNTLEAVIGAMLVRSYVGIPHRFERGGHVVSFVAVAMVSCAIAATTATLALGIGGFMPWAVFMDNWWTWWLGDVAGIIIVAPLLLAWSRAWSYRWSAARALEFAALAVLLTGTALAVFGDFIADGLASGLTFLVLPLIVWAAFRFTQREVATAIAVVCGIAVWYTVVGRGPFAMDSLNQSLLLLQAFMSTVAVTGLALAAVLAERGRVDASLRRANEELERFVHVTAHDLQEPLRTVINFAELLDRRNRHRLDGEAREFVGFIVTGVARMQRILSDLLLLSRIDVKEVSRGELDCEKMLASVREGLKVALDEAGAALTHDPLPKVKGDGTLLELVFQNLIGNAIKFRGAEPPRIHVGAWRQGGDWVFSVRDNGIGIDARHFGTIFEMYQRLDAAERYPGSGIGLTICKKIVDRHDGRIWLESREGAGTTFYFTVSAE
jgi:signal transduction histidine kinase